MKFTLVSRPSVLVALMAAWSVAVCRALPTVQRTLFPDEKSETESEAQNEVGPAEDWTLLQRLTKTNAVDPAYTEKTRALIKEIEEFTRIAADEVALAAANASATDAPDENETTAVPTTTVAAAAMDDDDGDVAAVTESDPASSDWANSWRSSVRNGDGDDDLFGRQEADDGNFEEIVKKISNDLKKLYVKIKQVLTVVKNWVNTARGQRSGFDESFTMSGSGSESDGVFVIGDALVGDIDKSNKYTVPIHAD